jgi:hypothetical protein
MLQWRSNAFTRARILRLFRHNIRTWVRERTAICCHNISDCSMYRVYSGSTYHILSKEREAIQRAHGRTERGPVVSWCSSERTRNSTACYCREVL